MDYGFCSSKKGLGTVKRNSKDGLKESWIALTDACLLM